MAFLTLILFLTLLALATAQDYFLNCGSATDTRFVTVPSDTESRVASLAPISGATSPYLYQNHRTTTASATAFTYVFPRRFPGAYLVEFAFAEITNRNNTARCATGVRRFNAFVQDEQVLQDFDVFAKAGCRRATKERFNTLVGVDGRLEFRFAVGSSGRPMVSYIKTVRLGALPRTQVPTTAMAAVTLPDVARGDFSDGDGPDLGDGDGPFLQDADGGIDVPVVLPE